MTNEEAIKAMTKYMPKDNDSVSLVLREAMNMGIKALEQELCEDYISRAQALSDYADWYGYGYRDNTFYKHLKDMPPVTPQPKTDVLDKIRAEIKEESRFCPLTEGLERALEIIDKYKAESEE